MSNPISQIPTEQLTHELWKKSQVESKLDYQWTIMKEQRLAVLAEITEWFEGESHASAERKARVTPEYQEFLTKMGKVKQELILARARTKIVDQEIKLRINRSFKERSEYNAGHITT